MEIFVAAFPQSITRGRAVQTSSRSANCEGGVYAALAPKEESLPSYPIKKSKRLQNLYGSPERLS